MADDQSTPQLHPEEDVLAAHAAGQLDLTQRVLIEAHLSYCSPCREGAAALTQPGGQWLSNQTATPPADHLWQSLEAQIGQQPQESSIYQDSPVPLVVQRELPVRTKPLRWRNAPFSASRFASMIADAENQTGLYLLHSPAGRTFPAHRHLGEEIGICLTGGFRDEFGQFETGDYYGYTPGSHHRLLIDPGDPCWIIVRIEKGIQYLGWRGFAQRLRDLQRRLRR